MADHYVAYVGTYTLGSSKGIYIYDADTENCGLTLRKVVPVKNSSHLCRSINGKYLYSIADEGVAVFAIKPDGDLEMINEVGISGMRGCHLSVGPRKKFLYVAGYYDGKVTLVHTHRDGRLGSEVAGVFHKGLGSVVERSFRPHVSCVTPTPDGNYCCAVDNGIDQVKIYSVSESGKLKQEDILRCMPGDAPRNFKFSPNGRFAYLICEMSNIIRVYSYDGTQEAKHLFEKKQEISTAPEKADPGHDATSGICFSEDGRYLFVSVAGSNVVTMFEVNPDDGTLTRRFCLPVSGDYPKDVKLFPGGKYLASVNHSSGTITTFRVDYEKNLITMKGKPVEVDTPNCIVFTRVMG